MTDTYVRATEIDAWKIEVRDQLSKAVNDFMADFPDNVVQDKSGTSRKIYIDHVEVYPEVAVKSGEHFILPGILFVRYERKVGDGAPIEMADTVAADVHFGVVDGKAYAVNVNYNPGQLK